MSLQGKLGDWEEAGLSDRATCQRILQHEHGHTRHYALYALTVRAPTRAVRRRGLPMGLTAEARWKEQLIISDEDGRKFCFECAWGVEPPIAYVPAVADWPRCVPGWLRDRRDEVIAVMKAQRHLVHEGLYPDYVE